MVSRSALVLDGNMYLASEWAAATKKGQGIIYTDERGIRHRGVLMKEGSTGDMMSHMPVRLWAPAMIRELVRRTTHVNEQGQASFDAGEMMFATSIQGALDRHGDSTRFLVVPGKGVALSVNKKELSRISRALRAALKAELRLEHPDFKNYSPERKEQVQASMLSVATSAKKGKRPIIFIECQNDEQSDKAVDLVCRTSGIEIYVARGSRMGDLADEIQRSYFEQRRVAAQDVIDRARGAASATASAPQEPPAQAQEQPAGDANPQESLARTRQAA